MIPAHLLNATVTFFRESHVPGEFGEPVKTLTRFGQSRARADMQGESRAVTDLNFEQRRRSFLLCCNETPPNMDTRVWVEVVSDYNAFTFIGQVDSVAYSGLAATHSEMKVIENPPLTGVNIIR